MSALSFDQAIKTLTVGILIQEKMLNIGFKLDINDWWKKNTKFWGWPLNIFYLVYTICPYRIKDINLAKCHCFRIVI